MLPPYTHITGRAVENVNAVSVITHAAGQEQPPAVVESPMFQTAGAPVPAEVFNASWPGLASNASLTASSGRTTEADRIVLALFRNIVKQGDFSTINADLDALSRVLVGSIGFCDTADEQRISNMCLGKALNILCQLVRRSGELACDSHRLIRATHRCADVLAAREAFTLENVSVIMFHLGELINYPPLQRVSSKVITDHLAPIFEAALRQQPLHTVEAATLALGLVSTLRASEHQLTRPHGLPIPRPAADALLTTLQTLMEAQPDLVTTWETRTLALVSKYGVQYLRRLALLNTRGGRIMPADAQQFTVARVIKPILEEARQPWRGEWDQRQSEYHGMPLEKQLKDYLTYSSHYYGCWLNRQAEWVQVRFGLQEAARGPLADNPHDGRAFAEVARRAAGMMAPPAGTVSLRRPLSLEVAALEPPTALARFSQAAGALWRLDHAADNFDRDEAIVAANALITSIEAGSTPLNTSLRVQMLLEMDGVCMRLHAADPWDLPRYAWQLSSMRSFLSAQLALLVDANGVPMLGTSVPFESGLSSWQRMLLKELIDHDAKATAS
ncbi:hypothetical protein [Stenotrophomonas sp. AB1(2024)]|uniref:hypothetical protein n=1 Tax=Stenotrophomonas sp. AB1(2024) TaxID=3132215 RepID=UPI0030B3E5FA